MKIILKNGTTVQAGSAIVLKPINPYTLELEFYLNGVAASLNASSVQRVES